MVIMPIRKGKKRLPGKQKNAGRQVPVAPTQAEKASAFLSMHRNSELLVLPNAWDSASAKIFELEGFQAIGTTSAGIAAMLGYADGQEMPRRDNISAIQRIVRSTPLPVSADIEAGYSDTVEGVVICARCVLDVGAVGLNIEDGTGDPTRPLHDLAAQYGKISAIRLMSKVAKIHLVINARTDTFLVLDDPQLALRTTIARGNAYYEAGADCVFVPDMGNLDKEGIRTLVKEIEAPVNIIAGERTPPVQELKDLGVARLSLGPRPMRAVLSQLRQIAREIRSNGTYQQMNESSISYSDVNSWFS
jgi:2-methylisocitrate lyase-like PEP mutase family enzyme